MKRYVVVRKNCCFIFIDEFASSPLYKIPLDDIYAEHENQSKQDSQIVKVSPESTKISVKKPTSTVLLRFSHNRKIAYQFTFNSNDSIEVAKSFFNSVMVLGARYVCV